MTLRLPRTWRDATRPYVARIPVPILSGPNRGRWWSLAGAGSGFGTGRRELARMLLIERLIRANDSVWDVGAHRGYVTLCAASRVARPEQVHAFEPSETNARLLRRHLAWNDLRDVHVHQLALSDFDGTACFGGDGASTLYSLGKGSERVTVRRGVGLIATGVAPPPTFLKIDVEGAEADVVRGLVEELRPDAQLLIAVHSTQAYKECRALLEPRGFLLIGTIELHRALEHGFGCDPDLLALGPACRTPSRRTREIGGLITTDEIPD